jgi:hypothetical protein
MTGTRPACRKNPFYVWMILFHRYPPYITVRTRRRANVCFYVLLAEISPERFGC